MRSKPDLDHRATDLFEVPSGRVMAPNDRLRDMAEYDRVFTISTKVLVHSILIHTISKPTRPLAARSTDDCTQSLAAQAFKLHIKSQRGKGNITNLIPASNSVAVPRCRTAERRWRCDLFERFMHAVRANAAMRSFS